MKDLTRNDWLMIGIAVILAIVAAQIMFPNAISDVVQNTLDFLDFRKGRKLNNTSVNAQGYIDTAPYTLIGEAETLIGASIDRDIYALARSGRSEGSNGMEARMHVMLTQAAESGMDVFTRTVSQPGSPKDGFFGTQRGRRWASSRDPYEGDLALANKVIRDHANGNDPTGGAGRFVDRSAFGKQEGTRTYAEVVDEWRREGYEPYHYPDASQDFVLFRRGGVPDGFKTA